MGIMKVSGCFFLGWGRFFESSVYILAHRNILGVIRRNRITYIMVMSGSPIYFLYFDTE